MTHQTARDAWHDFRRRDYETRKTEEFASPHLYWTGGSEAVSRIGGAHRVSKNQTFRPNEGRPQLHSGRAFAELEYAARSGVTRPHLPRTAETAARVKRIIRQGIELSRRCPAPVLP